MVRWPFRALKDLATISVGVTTPPRRDGEPSYGPEYPVVSVGSLQQEGIAPRDTLAHLPLVLSDAERSRAMLRPGDVLLSARGAALRMALVHDEHAGAVASSTLLVIRSLGQVGGATLYAALRTPVSVQRLEQIARTSTATRAWRPSDVGAITLPVPPHDVQEMVRQLVEADGEYQSAALRALELRQDVVRALLADVLYGQGNVG